MGVSIWGIAIHGCYQGQVQAKTERKLHKLQEMYRSLSHKRGRLDRSKARMLYVLQM